MTGGSGFIGRRLLKSLAADGHTLHVLSRHAGTNLPGGVKLSAWDSLKGEPPADSIRTADVVIHLAGAPVAQRWTEDSKRVIRETRVTGTRNLVASLAKLEKRPAALLCASAVGYYGPHGDETLTESAPPGHDFLADVCQEWEKEAMAAQSLGIRVACLRTGLVLGAGGGALQRMLPPFRLGAGGRLGSGRQWVSWIHVQDLVDLYRFAAAKAALSGAVNAVAPAPVTNADFTKALAAAVHRPAIFPVPAFGMKILFGEMAEMLLTGQRVVPKAAEAAGFQFKFREVGVALADAVKA